MSSEKPIKLYAAAVLAMVCFSLSFIWFKDANIAYKPITIVLFRLSISSVILFVFTKLTGKFIMPDKKDFKFLLLLALFEPFLYFMGESFGMQYISSTVAAVIIATIPLFAPIAAWLFYKEKVSVRNIIGILLSFAGVLLVIYEFGVGMTASTLGVSLEFVAVISAVAYTVVLHKISTRINNLSIILFQNVIGAIYFLPFWLVFERKGFMETSFNPDAFMAIIYLAIFASTFAFIFFTYSLRHLGITKANMFVNSIPVFTAILAWQFRNEMLSFQKVMGIVVVISGLFLAQMSLKKKKRTHPDPIPRT